VAVTLSYDVANISTNDRNYIRSMLERFHWRRLGGSVFRYSGTTDINGDVYEDWLNHVVPAIMFFRSFVLANNIHLRFFTLDANSISLLDHSDPAELLGSAPAKGPGLVFATPSNGRSSVKTIRKVVDAAIKAI